MSTEERRVQLVTEVDTTGARAGFEEVSQQAGQMAGNVTRAGERAERAVNGVGSGAGRSAQRVQNAERSIVNSIQRTTAQMESGSRTSAQYYEVLARQRGVNPNVLRPYLDQLRSVELAQHRAAQTAGQSAGQIRSAMAQVPAQMTDILVSLQGGQNALTVALQQGGQLRDSFGGIVPAARALGGQLMALVNPYTLVVAGAAGLAYAFVKGSAEARAYNLAIATTGNIAGTSASQLAGAAEQVSDLVGSQSAAAEVLASMTATGRIASGDMAALAMEAIKSQRDLGREVATTVDEYAALGKDPVAALAELNSKYHHVTAATFSQVKALQEEGRASEAASLAQRAHAAGLEAQRAQVVENLGYIERAWKSIKTEIGEVAGAAADFFLDLGRAETPHEKVNRLLREQARIQANITLGIENDDKWLQRKQGKLLEVNKAEVAAARAEASAEDERSAARSRQAKADELRISIAKQADSLLSREEQRRKALSAAEEKATSLGIKGKELETYLALIRKEYSDVDEAAKRKQEEASKKVADQLKKEAAAMAEMAGLTTSFADDWKLLSDMYAKGAISLAQLEKAQADLLAKQPAMKTAAEAELADRKSLAEAVEQYAKALDLTAAGKARAVSDLQAQRDENEQIGLGAMALAELNAVRLEDMALRAEQKIMMAEGLDISGKMAQDLRDEAAALRERAVAVREGAAKQVAFDTTKKAQDELNQFLDPSRAQNFGEALREAFGTAGDAISRMTASLDGFAQRQAEISKNRANAEKLRGTKDFDEIKYQQTMLELSQRDTKNRLAGYGAMTSAAAGFFGEQSKGYQALMAVSKVFHAAELAMTLAELVPKGIAAVLNQGSGDPYSAFGRMAAMAAIVAGLGVAIGGVGSGGVSLSESRQKTQGTGSVLGSADKSESIASSLEIMESLASKDLNISTGMLNSLRNIEAGIGQFASLLVRTTGVSGEFGAGLGTGYSGLSKGIGKAGMLGGGIAGGMAGGAIASVMTMGSVGTLSTTALGAIAGPLGMVAGAVLGAVFGKQLGKVSNAIFGGKKTVEDTGFTLSRESFGSILSSGADAWQYADVKTDGGWFGRDKVKPVFEGLGAEGNRQISTILTSLYGTVFEAGKMLGINGDAFSAQLNSFVVDIGRVSLKGKTGEEIQAELSAIFSKLGDDLAAFGVAGITQFQQVGEGALETLARVASNYASLDAVLMSIGKSFGATGVASIGAREELLRLAGGIDNLAGQVSSFAENYLTEAERLAPVQKYVTEQLASMGLAATLKSRESFKQYVLGLDLTNAAQRAQYAQLMSLQEAFAKLYPEIKDVEDKTRSIADAKAALADAYNAESDAIGATIDRMSSFAASLKSLRENALLGGMSPLSPQQKYAEAKAQYEAVLAAARAGDEGAQSNYQGAYNAFLAASRAIFASSGQYTRDFDYAQAATAEAARWAEAQVDVGKSQLALLKSQVSGLIDVNKSVLSVREAILQLHQAEGTAPIGPQMPAPVFHVSPAVYGAPNTEPLVAEIKALRQEVSTLRAEQARQTGDMIRANAQASRESAADIAGATTTAVKSAAYREERVYPE